MHHRLHKLESMSLSGIALHGGGFHDKLVELSQLAAGTSGRGPDEDSRIRACFVSV